MKPLILILLTCLLVGRVSAEEEATLTDRLQDKDSVVLLRVDSKKPAKVEIFHCTVEKISMGKATGKEIVLSFLHFPGCQRLSVGERYLCAIRHDSGTGYTLIRSDMLAGSKQAELCNYAWKVDSPEARRLLKHIEEAQQVGGGQPATRPKSK